MHLVASIGSRKTERGEREKGVEGPNQTTPQKLWYSLYYISFTVHWLYLIVQYLEVRGWTNHAVFYLESAVMHVLDWIFTCVTAQLNTQQNCRRTFKNHEWYTWVKYAVRSPKFIWAPRAQLYSLAEETPHLDSYTRALMVNGVRMFWMIGTRGTGKRMDV